MILLLNFIKTFLKFYNNIKLISIIFQKRILSF
jgi:hypothetical protein